eukprot:Selendium_serpulae@DN8442_c0_g1_i1.p1
MTTALDGPRACSAMGPAAVPGRGTRRIGASTTFCLHLLLLVSLLSTPTTAQDIQLTLFDPPDVVGLGLGAVTEVTSAFDAHCLVHPHAPLSFAPPPDEAAEEGIV